MEITTQEFQMLWYDKSYNVLTRPAIEITFNRRSKSIDWVVFIDLDNIHNINTAHAVDGKNGYAITDALIRRAFEGVIRKEDLFTCTHAGRHQSGDEVVFYINGDPDVFCARLQQCLNEVGLSATMSYCQPKETYEETLDECAAKVQAAKKSNQRGSIRR